MATQTVNVGEGDSWASLAGQLSGDQRQYATLAAQNGGLERELHPGDTVTYDDSQAQKDPFISNADRAKTPTGYSNGQEQFGNQGQAQPAQDPSQLYNAAGYAWHTSTFPDGTQNTSIMHQDGAASLNATGIDVKPVAHPNSPPPAMGQSGAKYWHPGDDPTPAALDADLARYFKPEFFNLPVEVRRNPLNWGQYLRTNTSGDPNQPDPWARALGQDLSESEFSMVGMPIAALLNKLAGQTFPYEWKNGGWAQTQDYKNGVWVPTGK